MMALGVPAAAATAAVLIPASCLLDACSAAMQRCGTVRNAMVRCAMILSAAACCFVLVASCSSSLFEAFFIL